MEVELGARRYDITIAVPRDGDPEPHARLVLRPGRLLPIRRLPPQGRAARRRRGRPPRRRRREGRPRRRGRRGRGARSRRAGDRGAVRAVRRARLSRHVASVGGRGRVRRRRGGRQRHQRLRRPGVPHRRRSGAARPSSRPTSGSAPASPTRTRSTTTCVGDGRGVLRRARGACGGGRHPSTADHRRRRPRPRQDARHSRSCCCASSRALAALGYPVLLSASNKRFLGELLDLDVGERREATVAAHALGITLGCRILRAHDVRGARRTADVLAARARGRRSLTRASAAGRPTRPFWPMRSASSSHAARRRRRSRALVVDDISDETYEGPPRDRRRGAAHLPSSRASAWSSLATSSSSLARTTSRRSSNTSPTRSTRPSWCSSPAAAVHEGTRRGREEGRPRRRHRPGTQDEASGSTGSLEEAAVKLDPAARELVVERLGEDLGRLPALLDGLECRPTGPAPVSATTTSSPSSARPAAFRRGSSPTRSTVATPPRALDLPGADDRRGGERASAPDPGDAVTATTARVLRLDGRRRRRDEKSAAGLLGLKGSTFPARKALEQARRLGPQRRARGPTSCWRARTSTCGGARVARRAVAGGAGGPPGRARRQAPAGPPRAGVRSCSAGQLLHEAGLAPGGLVLVDDALGGGLVEALAAPARTASSAFSAPLGGARSRS